MADWTTISSLATAGGTLILAVATFMATRSSNRSARVAERSLMAGLRPLLVSSRLQDPAQKVGFQDRHWVRVDGGMASAEVGDDAVYLVMSVRNVGAGIAALDRWQFHTGEIAGVDGYDDPAGWRRLTRDIFVAPGDMGFWQGAIRDRGDPDFDAAVDAIQAREPMRIDLLYGDFEGGQRTITRFAIVPAHEDRWLTVAGRHWNLDRADPR